MATALVIGIFPESDPKALESALSAQQIDLTKIKVVSTSATDTESSTLTFVDVVTELDSDSFSDEMTKGTGVIPDSGGTGVPGVTGREERESIPMMGEESPHYLDGYDVPDDEIDNFDDAVAEGRAVVLYPNPGANEAAIAAAFKAAGLLNVRAY